MSFTKMSKQELFKLATNNFGVDVDETATKQQILARLAEDGVTWDMAVAFDKNARAIEEQNQANVVTSEQVLVPDTKKEEPVVAQTAQTVVATTSVPEKVLLVMDRENPSFEIRGYKFTRTHPFSIVSSDDAEYIVSNVEGFRLATRREAEDFYG